MTELCRCWSCKDQLEPAQQLRFLVETDNLDNPAYLSHIRVLPSVKGRPIPVCKACQAQIEAAPRRPVVKLQPKPVAVSGLLGALGALSVGLLISGLFAPRG